MLKITLALVFAFSFFLLAAVATSFVERVTDDKEDDNYQALYGYDYYNDTAAEPRSECAVGPLCPRMQGNWAGNSVTKQNCETYVHCFEVEIFPDYLPAKANILTVQGSFFKNLTSDNLKNLTNLSEVILEYNELELIEPGAFRRQTNLQILRIQGNRFGNIPRDTFAGLHTVIKLDLTFNEIRTIYEGSFLGLNATRDLSLNLNQITSLDDYTFRGLTMLETLALQDNNISFISPMAFRELSNLRNLNLKSNHLTAIPTKPIKALPSLTTLFLGKNPISSIARSDLKGVRTLRHLWLENCEIKTIAKRAFKDKNLYTLVLERNLLNNFPKLGRMSQLHVLSLEDNPWICDSKAIPMRNWLLQHDVADIFVQCALPEYRRGRNLLFYSEDDLLHGTGVRNPDSVTRSTMITQNIIPDPMTTSLETIANVSSSRIVRQTTSSSIQSGVFNTQADDVDMSFAQVNVTLGNDVQETSGEEDENNREVNTQGVAETEHRVKHLGTKDNKQSLDASQVVSNDDVANKTRSTKYLPEEEIDFSLIIVIIVAMTTGIVLVVVFVVWKLKLRRLSRRRRRFQRAAALQDAAKLRHKSAVENGCNLQRHKNERRCKPDSSKTHGNDVSNGNLHLVKLKDVPNGDDTGGVYLGEKSAT